MRTALVLVRCVGTRASDTTRLLGSSCYPGSLPLSTSCSPAWPAQGPSPWEELTSPRAQLPQWTPRSHLQLSPSGPSCSRGWPQEGGTGRGQSRPAPYPVARRSTKACHRGSVGASPVPWDPTPQLAQPPLWGCPHTSVPKPLTVFASATTAHTSVLAQPCGWPRGARGPPPPGPGSRGHSPGHTHLASPQADHRPDMTCRQAAVTTGTGSGE